METFLFIVFFVSCIVLIGTVLLQPGKTDAGALFTSGVSSASMNPRGTASVLSKLTIASATIFMLSALLLSLPAITGKSSVLDSQNPTSPTLGSSNSNSNQSNNNADSNDAKAANSESNDSTKSESNKSETKDDEKKSEDKNDKDAAAKDKKGDTKKEEKKEDAKKDELKKAAEDSDGKKEDK